MKRLTIRLVAAVMATLLGSVTVLAGAPEPVVPQNPGSPAVPVEPPAYDPTEPYQDDRSGRCPAGNTRIGPDGVLDLTRRPELTGVPGPVVPVDIVTGGEADPCLAEFNLQLLIEAPDDKKPEGANGNLDGIAVPRSSLESRFEVTLPAQDRVITLQDPGRNWELKSTSCSCSGWSSLSASGGGAVAAAPSDRASFPGPVVPVPAPAGGPGGCSGASPSVIAGTSAPPALMAPNGLTELTSYPAPVVPVVSFQPPQLQWSEDGTVTLTDPDAVGGTFTCVWTVELVYGQLDIETITKPSGEEGRFRYEVVPTGGQPNAAAMTVTGGLSERLRWGPWTVTLDEPPEGWEVKSSSCSESDSELLSLADGSFAQVGLDQDDAVKCRFELELLAPKPGRWLADNKAGRGSCSSQGFRLPFNLDRATDFGRIRVRDGGDTFVASGGGQSYTFRRDRDDPLRYTSKKRFRQSGISLVFDIRLNLRSETRMAGTVRARSKGRGATCDFRRPLTLTHASSN